MVAIVDVETRTRNDQHVFSFEQMQGEILVVELRQQIRIDTVEEKPPFGIAGTGIVDLVAELVRVGVLDASGRMLDTEQWPAWLRERAHLAGEMRAFIVARDPENRPLYLHQGDVRELQLAKAATATAIHYVMDAAKVTAAEIDRVYVAGAFGSYLDPVSILRIALLPEVPLERVELIGNAALACAVPATPSRKHLDNAVRVARDAPTGRANAHHRAPRPRDTLGRRATRP